MLRKKPNLIHFGLAVLICSTLLGCSPPIVGAPSLTLLTDNTADNYLTPISNTVEESECLTWALFYTWSGYLQPSTEALVSRTLEKYQADAFLKTELTFSTLGIPFIYMRMCENLKGIPARYVPGGDK
jgi:hypothetical protein